MNNHNTYRIVTFLVALIILSFYLSCAMPTMSRFSVDDASVQEIFKTVDTLSLAWDYDQPANIDSYKLHYKELNAVGWTPFPGGTISSDIPLFEMDHTEIGDGSWVFGVSTIENGTESEIHSSLDNNAEPATGWYLLWVE